MVHGQQQHPVLRPQAQQPGAQQGASPQVEGPLGLFGGQPPGLGFGIGSGRQVHGYQGRGQPGVEHLHRLAVSALEGGA